MNKSSHWAFNGAAGISARDCQQIINKLSTSYPPPILTRKLRRRDKIQQQRKSYPPKIGPSINIRFNKSKE